MDAFQCTWELTKQHQTLPSPCVILKAITLGLVSLRARPSKLERMVWYVWWGRCVHCGILIAEPCKACKVFC